MLHRIAIAALLPLAAAAAPDALDAPGKAENFRLIDHNGRSHELYRLGAQHRAVLLYVLGQHCGEADLAGLAAAAPRLRAGNLPCFLIDASPERDPERLRRGMAAAGLDFPVLIDPSQAVLRALGVTQARETLLVETAEWRILYRGPLQGVEARILALMTGNAPAEPVVTPFEGCPIEWREWPTEFSYANDIAPILERHCVACHQQGNIGPFPLDSHRRARGWSEMIRETILTDRMPPWHADPEHARFANDRSLSDGDKTALLAWIAAGAPKDPAEPDPLAKAAAAGPPPEWALGEPDHLVVLPRVQRIPAAGIVDYRYVEVPSGLEEDRWLRAVDVQPTNHEVTHHILVFIRYPQERRREQHDPEGGLDGFFAGYVPGTFPEPFPDHTGKLVPAGASFIFQLHYNVIGKEAEDRPRMGLYFHDGPPAEELSTRAASNALFEIPPGHPDFEVEAEHWIRRNATLWSLSPHMHYRGSRMRYEARYPNGDTEILLSVPHFLFDWQTTYRIDPPRRLPAGTVIRAVGAFDNSPANPYNPDPTSTVRFGEQSFEEMFIGYLHYSIDPAEPQLPFSERPRPAVQETDAAPEAGTPAEFPPLTPDGLPNTTWTIIDYRLRFEPEGRVLVNNAVWGEYEVQGNRVAMRVAGGAYQFTIEDGKLIAQGGHALRRIE